MRTSTVGQAEDTPVASWLITLYFFFGLMAQKFGEFKKLYFETMDSVNGL